MLDLTASKINLRHALLLFVFFLTCTFSFVTLWPHSSSYRYPIFERFLDIFYLMFMIFGTTKSTENISKNLIAIFSIFFLIFLSSIFAINNFDVLYALIEYRQYLLIGSSVAILRLLKRQLDATAIISTFPIYLAFLLANTIAGWHFKEYYRPGVFGENNYDIAYLGVVALANFWKKGNTYNPLPMMLLFSLISQSRTAIIICLLLTLVRVRNMTALLAFLIVSTLAYYVLQTRLAVSNEQDFSITFITLDRIQMLLAYIEAVNSDPLLGVFGQAFSGITFVSDRMDFYLNTQLASDSLGFNTPSNFHGHGLRGFMLLGSILYLAFIWATLNQSKRLHNCHATTLIVIIVVSTWITQSIFSHPFSGTLFALTCLVGFANKKNPV